MRYDVKIAIYDLNEIEAYELSNTLRDLWNWESRPLVEVCRDGYRLTLSGRGVLPEDDGNPQNLQKSLQEATWSYANRYVPVKMEVIQLDVLPIKKLESAKSDYDEWLQHDGDSGISKRCIDKAEKALADIEESYKRTVNALAKERLLYINKALEEFRTELENSNLNKDQKDLLYKLAQPKMKNILLVPPDGHTNRVAESVRHLLRWDSHPTMGGCIEVSLKFRPKTWETGK